jgi:prepilin-type N-terminal cleavage/methylation domain-containing protein
VRKGFTLIEVAVVTALLALTLFPLLEMTAASYDHYGSLAIQAGLKADADALAYRIFGRVAANPRACQLDADNHGIRFADGAAVRWQEGMVWWIGPSGRRPLMEVPVSEFNLVRQGGLLTLNLELRAPARVHGPAVAYRNLYDYPRLGGQP